MREQVLPCATGAAACRRCFVCVNLALRLIALPRNTTITIIMNGSPTPSNRAPPAGLKRNSRGALKPSKFTCPRCAQYLKNRELPLLSVVASQQQRMRAATDPRSGCRSLRWIFRRPSQEAVLPLQEGEPRRVRTGHACGARAQAQLTARRPRPRHGPQGHRRRSASAATARRSPRRVRLCQTHV